MKKFYLMLLCAMALSSTYAQLPKWIIPPVNDTIFVKIDNLLLQCEGAGKSSLWTMDGKQLYSTEQTILPFKDGVATILKKDGNTLSGFVSSSGNFTALPDISVAYDNPYFENGIITVRGEKGYEFYIKNGTGVKLPESVIAYPFHGGYAPYLSYIEPYQKKDPHYAYYKSNGETIQYSISSNGKFKPVEPKDIAFLSGIGSNGKGVAVIKDKLYWFNTETEFFEPLLWGNEQSEKKRHLKLVGNYEQYFHYLPSDSIVIQAKYGKERRARLRFDKTLVPTFFTFEDEKLVFESPQPAPIEYLSDLSSFGTGPFGLNLNSKKVLPCQFQQIGLMYGNKALVKTDNKWGVIELIPNLKYTLRINKDEDIAFRHQKFETRIRLDLPPEISAKDMRMDIPDSIGCILDKTSRETKDTESGNFVTYDCVLNIPASLPDTITTITYSPIRITYEGISLFDAYISVKAWHLKYYNVDPIESETTITNGVASFTININAQRNMGEGDYPFDVKVEADSVSVEYEKLSETRYKCMVSNLQEGINSLNILITEKNCPPSVFPFEVYYTKPVPKKRQKEGVVVRKKSTLTAKPDDTQPEIEL